MVGIRAILNLLFPEATTGPVLVREACMFLAAGLLLMIVRRAEGLPLTSIGIGTAPWPRSVLFGFALGIVSLVAAVLLASLTHYGHGPGASAFERLPLWVVTVVVLRAGIVEELFYRGYAIERLDSLGLGRGVASAIPLGIFALAHWTGGAANVLIALVLGGLLTGFYLWKRDLVANMIAHTFVDFVANVVGRLAG